MDSDKPEPPAVVRCPECGAKVIWTGLFGPWCAICRPRYRQGDRLAAIRTEYGA